MNEDENGEAENGLQMAARSACREFLLQTLDRPDDAELDNYQDWVVNQRPEGTMEVTMVGRIMDALGEMIDARWQCVVFPDAQQMRLVSLTMIGTRADETEVEATEPPREEEAPFGPAPEIETETDEFDPAAEAETEDEPVQFQ